MSTRETIDRIEQVRDDIQFYAKELDDWKSNLDREASQLASEFDAGSGEFNDAVSRTGLIMVDAKENLEVCYSNFDSVISVLESV
ncbi:hypothetical protein FACS1894125_2380 [Actinomycetota bacterium]|nr:hypothetical protein FACS1894125_2380 [Actinomycetota bacterium]